jgi:O-acetyl-ADP-ribose deacetylase (regulator of RNase III)
VIHTVGPVYRGGEQGEAETLASCHRESIRLADERGLVSLSFPAISTGAFGYPVSEAAQVAITAAIDAMRSAKSLKSCRFILFDSDDLRQFERVAKKLEKTHSFQIEKANS